MGKKAGKSEWRSGCPLNASVQMLGDQWSLLIIRDMMLRGSRTFTELLNSYEMIATNVLANRLRRLEANGILTREQDAKDRRKQIYRLTEKGIDLGPVLTEMVLWAAAHEQTENAALVRKMRKDKKKFLAEIRQLWVEVAGRAGGKRVGSRRSSKHEERDSGRASGG
ncbi:MAG: helix-turn-helix domain-containing protein [Candidatus Acidiferrum sp.]